MLPNVCALSSEEENDGDREENAEERTRQPHEHPAFRANLDVCAAHILHIGTENKGGRSFA